ncbi:MAG: HEPN domain-containing protein, partial [Clostridiales bacterium]|nr:HEPN domain-containing protein [Clostridiales bacterium]
QSINRSYYAAFHALRALLAYDCFDSKKHSSILGYFNKNYIANEKIEQEYYRIIASAFDIRTKSDYQDFYIVSKDEAKKQLINAEGFINMIENYIDRWYKRVNNA